MTSRKIIDKLGVLRLANDIGNGTAILGTAFLNVMDETNTETLDFPLLGTAQQSICSLPCEDVFFGILKIANACFNIKEKKYINAILNFISGSSLIGSFVAYKMFTLKSVVSPSIAFSYLGFAVSSGIDLIGSIERVYHGYPSKNWIVEIEVHNIKSPTDERMTEKSTMKYKNEYRSAIIDGLVNLLKCIGWSLLAYSSIIGAGSLLISVGWSLIVASAALQLIRGTHSLLTCGFLKDEPLKKQPSLLDLYIVDSCSGSPTSTSPYGSKTPSPKNTTVIEFIVQK
jgi:hypothetical protein